MRIATWNVNGLRSRLDFVRHWLRERKPDLVGLQELKATDDQFPFAEFESEGYHAVVHTQKAWNGVGVLSRVPVEVTQRGLPDEEQLGARLISVRHPATEDSSELDFVTVYVPNGKTVEHDDFPAKLRWLGSLRRYLENRHDPGLATVLCGDFNICPQPIDSFKEDPTRIFHTPEERDRYHSVEQWGLRDLFRERYPDAPAFSWWDYRGGAFHRKLGLRIDFLLGTPTVVEQLESVEIDREFRKKQEGLTPSDHAPVIADLR